MDKPTPEALQKFCETALALAEDVRNARVKLGRGHLFYNDLPHCAIGHLAVRCDPDAMTKCSGAFTATRVALGLPLSADMGRYMMCQIDGVTRANDYYADSQAGLVADQLVELVRVAKETFADQP